jgi:peptidylprolyl isomerase
VTKQTIAASALAALALGLSACGSDKAPGVVLAPSGGLTQAPAPTTPTVPPALSQKPSVQIPKGPPPNHLVTQDIVPGTGQAAAAGQSVTVQYVGVNFKDGKEFDSSWKTGRPFTTTLTQGTGGVIPGWVQGISGMKVGGRRELIIPPNLAYGKTGPPGIGNNATLVFVVDLLSVG